MMASVLAMLESPYMTDQIRGFFKWCLLYFYSPFRNLFIRIDSSQDGVALTIEWQRSCML